MNSAANVTNVPDFDQWTTVTDNPKSYIRLYTTYWSRMVSSYGYIIIGVLAVVRNFIMSWRCGGNPSVEGFLQFST
jgi:hypothetical protein